MPADTGSNGLVACTHAVTIETEFVVAQAICNALGVDEKRTALQLSFRQAAFKGLVEVSEALHKHQSTAITNLLLYFDRCEQLSDLSALAAAVTTLTGLKEVYLDFRRCYKLPQHLQTRFTSRSKFLEVTCAKAILPICRIPFYSGFWCCRLV